eukprot:TRINITY_DN597_c0_g1_i1.p1 TRINITY_DN597_c0_g1~~TRINITY_DN597_c0_g1_i1.p1  ORF type:complete len:170 (+),score=24.50 TRINITY_DN597_c0_g1_i1:26-511(+)
MATTSAVVVDSLVQARTLSPRQKTYGDEQHEHAGIICEDFSSSLCLPKTLRPSLIRRICRRSIYQGVRALSSAGGGSNLAVGRGDGSLVLSKGSPIVITEAPPFVKTAEPMPMLKPNDGILNVGDAGRVLDRRPKGVWAIRFASGAYLIDRKYFRPLSPDE